MLLLLLVLSGCKTSYNVTLKSSQFEYKQENFDVCQVITKIEGKKISKYDRSPGKIETDDYDVACPNLQIHDLGKQEVKIQINSVPVTLDFTIVDTTPPTIKVDTSTFNVEEGNTYFDIKKLVTVTDAYDPNPAVGFSGSYDLNKPGTYTVTIKAQDSSKNTATKTVNIHVTQKEVQVIEKEVPVTNNTVPNTPHAQQPAPNAPNTPIQAPSASSLPPKTFMFTDGYDLISGFDACKTYRGSNSGSCSPIQNADGMPYGYQYKP